MKRDDSDEELLIYTYCLVLYSMLIYIILKVKIVRLTG